MGTYYNGASRTGTFWQKHSLSIVLLAILIVQTIFAIWTGHEVWLGEQQLFNQPLDYRDFWIWWSWEYNVSLVADTFGVILIVLLSKRLREIGSAEDKENK